MRYVTSMGEVYKLSDRNYMKLLRLAAADKDFELETLGKHIGMIDMNVTDITPDEAQDVLDELKADRERG